MSTKALKGQLLAAIAMTLVAAVALGSSTFAWFAQNTTVTATDLEVTVKSDNTFLLIGTGNDDTADEIQAAATNDTVSLTVANPAVYPSSPAMDATEVGYLTTSGKTVTGSTITTAGVQVTNQATAAAVTNWFTANASSTGASTIDTSTARQLTAFDNYVIHKTVYLTVADGSNSANNLTVTPTITQKTGGSDISAVKVLITTDDGGFATLTNTSIAPVDIKGTNTAITDSTVRAVDIYIYYDGDESVVYTQNFASLKGADISLVFGVSAVSTPAS